MAKRIRQSKQRDAILYALQHTTSHPTAEAVYETVRQGIPDISLGTVYRNLNFLADENVIRRVKSIDNNVHFDGNVTPHYHMMCEKCGRIIDLFPTEEEYRSLIAFAEKQGHKISFTSVNFVGCCKDCLKKEENLL
jgi:Fe2+ or Zn2+ uptake regulation protein